MAKSGHEPAIVFAVIALLNETVGAVCVALGLFTRFFAASIAIELAMISVQFFPNGYAWARHGWEFVFLWGLVFFAIALRGGGPYSLDRKIGWEAVAGPRLSRQRSVVSEEHSWLLLSGIADSYSSNLKTML